MGCIEMTLLQMHSQHSEWINSNMGCIEMIFALIMRAVVI